MKQIHAPKAITMWDFSYMERRWTGGGYENWETALDELTGRGYDAVRIDAYPHLFAKDPEGEWTLRPAWDQQAWGAPLITKIDHLKENLLCFITLCKEREIMVGLSTWFREDLERTYMQIKTPADLAGVWKAVLDAVEEAGLLDSILYVDLCNEYPQNCWAPFLKNDPAYEAAIAAGELKRGEDIPRHAPIAVQWMKESLEVLRKDYPELLYTFSQVGEYETMAAQDTSMLDVLEPHIWMSAYSEYYEKLGYGYARFDPKDFQNLALNGERIYRGNASYWDEKLKEGVRFHADWSRKAGKPLITTECWGLVDFKDGPLLHWDWIKHLCEIGTYAAIGEGRWMAIATSNFCGPQFVGMWRDARWHQKLTDAIKKGKLPE